MRKLLLLLLFIPLIGGRVAAQSIDSLQSVVDSLSTKINVLEHDLDYLKVSYELETLETDLGLFNSEINTKSLEIRINLYHDGLSWDLIDVYQEFYKAAVQRKDGFASLMEAKKEYLVLKLITGSFTQKERDLLLNTYDVCEQAFATLEKALDVMEILVDICKKQY